MQNMLNHKDRLQWHKNSLIERSGYVLFYMNSLRDHVPTEDRQTLYIIAKYFTDAVEYARTNIPAAEYFFEIGEKYHCEIPEDKVLLRKLIYNSYDRAKSYYYFKIKDYERAIGRIEHTLQINADLKEKFPILVFDSISHYQNLLKVLVFQDRKEEANKILFEVVKFLLTGNTELKTLENSFSIVNDKTFHDFKQYFLNEFIFNYMFTNSDFNIALENILDFYKNENESVKNEPISAFLKIYLDDSMNDDTVLTFREKYNTYFNGIPLKIIEEKNIA